VQHTARRGVQNAALLSATSNITPEPSWPSWITSLLQLYISGIVFQLVSGQALVILSNVFNFDIVFFVITVAFEAFVEQSNQTVTI